MTVRPIPTPGVTTLAAGHRRAGDAGHDTVPEYTTGALPKTACPRCHYAGPHTPGPGPHHARLVAQKGRA